MSKLRLQITMSLDGFVAGPNQSEKDPLGVGGMGLHEWAIELAAWRKEHGMEGGEVNASSAVIEESIANLGATIMGRNMFGGHPGPWNPDKPWNGWWGEEPPFHHPVFVLTSHARKPLELKGTTFTFVTDGIESALAQAKRAAGSKDIQVSGGANTASQYLKAGLIDEAYLNIAPILLGDGAHLFKGVGTDLHGLKLVRTIGTSKVAHLKFER